MFYAVDEYLQLPRDPTPWLVQGLIPSNGITNIYGKPKSGKSFLALGLGIAIANGDDEWNGFAVLKHGPVCYLQIDTPRGEWAERLEKVKKSLTISPQFHVADMLTAEYPFNIINPLTRENFKKHIDDINPTLTIIDTFREVHELDENDSTEMKKAMSALISSVGPQRAVCILSHSRKDTQFTQQGGDDLMYDTRGSTYIAGKVDTMIKLTMNEAGNGAMTYKGRGTKYGSVRMFQDKELGLVFRDEEDKLIDQMVAELLDQMSPGDKLKIKPLSEVARVRWEKQTGEILSAKTFERKIRKQLTRRK